MLALFTVLICFNLNSITKADNDNDYVNELPSQERYDFIKKVAQRIVDEVEVKETPKKEEIVIPDVELEKNNEYVNKLMEDEVAKLKTARKDNKNKPSRKNETKREDRADKYINFTFRTHLQAGLKDNVDLTIARKKRSMNTRETERSQGEKNSKLQRKRGAPEVPVKVVFDQSKGTEGNERKSSDQNDEVSSNRKDDDEKTIEEKSIEYKDFDRKDENTKTLEDKSSETKDSASENKSSYGLASESFEPKLQHLAKETVKQSGTETKTTEKINDTETNRKISFETTKHAVKKEEPNKFTTETDEGWYTQTSTTDDTDFITTTDISNTEAVPVPFENTPLVLELSSDNPTTKDEIADTTTVQPGTESTEPVTTVPTYEATATTAPVFQETVASIEKKVTRLVVDDESNSQKPKTKLSTVEESKKLMQTTHKFDTPAVNNANTATTQKTTDETTNMRFTTENIAEISSTRHSKTSVITNKDNETTVTELNKTKAKDNTPSLTVTKRLNGTEAGTEESKGTTVRNILRLGVVSEESNGDNSAYKADQLLRQGGEKVTTPANERLHFETLFKMAPKPTKKVRIPQVPLEKEVLSKTHKHGVQYYRVYEIDPAVNPFKRLRTDVRGNQNQPQYSPVYNYEPDAAFFSPNNRLGPNLREGDHEDDQADSRQTVSREPRMNIDQESFPPVYNYLPENAYYNPQNRLGPNDDNHEEYLYYKRAGVKAADKIKNPKDFDEDYYYARNEAIEDSRESRKFRFRNILASSGTKKTSFKERPFLRNNLLMGKLIFVPKQRSKKYQQASNNDYYMDNFNARNAVKKRKRNRNLKSRYSQISSDLDEYFNKKKKGRVGNKGQPPKRGLYYNKAFKPTDSNPISIDYYYGVNDRGKEVNLDNINDKIHDKKDTKTQKYNFLATKKREFQHRAIENNAIDLDYYFSRKQSEDPDEDFPDSADENDRDYALNMKTHLRNGHTKSKAENKDEKTEDLTKSSKKDLKLYTSVLKDMFEMNSGVLVKYDWLETTVNIRAALAKLAYLIDAKEHGEVINAHDEEILKYLIQVYNDASRSSGRRSTKDCVDLKFPLFVAESLRSKNRNFLPRNQKKKKGENIKNPLKLMNDVYYHLMRSCAEIKDRENNAISRNQDFKEFLRRLEDGLYNFHTAIKNIASVTKYHNQNWYRNIKDLYLSRTTPQSQELLAVLTHLVLMEVFERIEQSAKDGMEEDAAKYILTHREEFKETTRELVFVLRLLDEINKVED